MKTKILIVDDEPYVARTLARLLENKGFQRGGSNPELVGEK
jgi:DNA-binding response OmpR family regulator